MGKIQIVVSGLSWMGSGIGSIESAIENLLENAQHEILLTVYSIGKADRVFDLLESALARGIRVQMVVNRLSEQHDSIRFRLNTWQQTYGHFYLYPFEPGDERGELHAKVLVVDRKRALVGSSNLSYNGLILNHEMAVLVEGEDASVVGATIDKFIGTFSHVN